MRSRRRLLIAVAAGACVVPRWAWAQQPERRYRIGWLGTSPDSFRELQALAFVQRLGELGLVEGGSLSIERREGGNRLERLPAMAAELARLECDVLFAGGAEALLAALEQADLATPIVFIAVDFDLLAAGHVSSLARPGGRITGLDANQSELPRKRLELMKELLPGARRMAVFTNDQTAGQLAITQDAAKQLGLSLHVVDFKRPPFNYEAGFAAAARANADALVVLGSGLWVSARHRITELALKSRLPTMFHHSQWAAAGGLISYGYNFPAMWRRGAEMVTKILAGAKAGDIPVEQPTVYELVINMKTARMLGIKVPQSMQLRIDRVID